MKKRSKKLNVASQEKRLAIMKQINRDLACALQTLKRSMAQTAALNSSLKAELYDMMIERNNLMKEKIKIMDTLKNIGEVIGSTLNLKGLKRDRLGSKKQSATICPMVSGYAIRKPKVKLTRLNFKDYPNAANIRDDGYVFNLSTIVEEDQIKEVVKRRLGQRSLLSKNVPYSSIIDYKKPIILLERHPIFFKRPDHTSQIDDGIKSEVEEKLSIIPKTRTPNGIESKGLTTRSPSINTEKSLNSASSGTKAVRRSLRIRKEVDYKNM